MTNKTKDNPGVIAPPPLIFLSGLILGGIVQYFYPLGIFPSYFLIFSRITGTLFVVFGLWIIWNAHSKMKNANTNIEPWKPTNKILSDGIYSYSRNPVYVAMVFIYLGITLIFNALWLVPFLILVIFAIHFGVVLREEKYLETKFGEEYLKYKQSVRRWI